MCGVKETQCTHCNHLQICSFKAQFLAAQKAVDEVTVSTGDHLMCETLEKFGCHEGVKIFREAPKYYS